MKKAICKICKKRPHEISEYVERARSVKLTPEQFVIRDEGTYNPQTGNFYCTSCYIAVGMPLGKA